jgi:hypothetical protein
VSSPDALRPLPGRRPEPPRADGDSPADDFGATPTWAHGAVLRELPIDAIEPNPDQPRRRFDDAGLRALAGSLRERGLLQPVLVSPPREDGHYALIAGERRWRAAELAASNGWPHSSATTATAPRGSSWR